MAVLFTNNATTTLASGITNLATTLTVASGSGTLFPSLTGGDIFYTTLVDASNNIEIVKVTARSGDTLTVVRGQEGTTARTYASGSKVELRVTAAGLNSKADASSISSLTAATAGLTTLTSGFYNTVIASQNLTAGDFVNVYANGGALNVRKASALDPTKFANGFVLTAASSGDPITVQFFGTNTATTVSAPYTEVYLSDTTSGAYATTPPSATGSIIQPLGVAIPSVGVVFTLQKRDLL